MVSQQESPTAFGRRLVDERERAGWSQREVARTAGVSQAAVWLWEMRETPPAEPATIDRIAETYGLDRLELYALAGVLPPEVIEPLRQHPERMARVCTVILGWERRDARDA